MKKRILAMLMAALLLVGMLAGLSSCGKKESVDVAVLYYTYDDVYISSVRAALDKELTAAGVKYQDYNCNNTQATQNDYVKAAIANGAKLLVVNLVTSGSAETAEGIIKAAGNVPVIFFNRAVDGDDSVLKANNNICFIGTDAPEAGHLQGKMVGEYIIQNYDAIDLNHDGKISYAMFKGEEGNVEAIARTQFGQEDADKVLVENGKPAMEYFDPDAAADKRYQVDQAGAWSTQAAVDYMNANLGKFNETNGNMIEVVICNNDGMAEGVVSALKTAGYNNGSGKTIPVFGVDATDAAKGLIKEGSMTGTVKQDAEGMAGAIAKTTQAVLGGTAIAEAVGGAANGDNLTIADGVSNKLYVAYAPYMGE